MLIEQRMPEKSYKYPAKIYKDKKRKDGTYQRFCNSSWLEEFDFLAYSKEQDGLYCLACVLFPTPGQAGRAQRLIDQPYSNWKDARQHSSQHHSLDYHQKSYAKMEAFVKTRNHPEGRLDLSLTTVGQAQLQKNRSILACIIKCLELCGRQGIALRGHEESDDTNSNQGNFKALLNFRVESGDKILDEHLRTCARNATYISKTAQNDLLDCMKQYMQEKIVQEINQQSCGSIYGIQADEVTDTSNWEQLGLVIRYIKDFQPVEKLVEFIKCEKVTGSAICTEIVSAVHRLHLDVKKCRAQTYDGAGNMSGHLNGCAANFLKENPNAPYFHCASHNLNLALSKASKIPEISCMLDTLTTVGIFFKYSPKRQRQLEKDVLTINDQRKKDGSPLIASEKIKPMCQTRWVERHTTLADFEMMFEAICECLETIKANEKHCWDTKTITEATGLLASITSPAFIAAFKVNEYFFGYTKSLSCLLQGSCQDILVAYEEVQLIKAEFISIREKTPEKEFAKIFKTMLDMGKIAGLENIFIPRRCGRQTLRNNIPGSTPEEYWRRAIFLPFLDELISQFNSRFSHLASQAVQGLRLLPVNITEFTEEEENKVKQYYIHDLPSPSSFAQEVKLWRRKWNFAEKIPQNLKETLESTSQKMFPNIFQILCLLNIVPVPV